MFALDCFEHVVRQLSLCDQLTLLLTSQFLCRLTQPDVYRHKRRMIALVRNWKIRVLPWTSSRTRREIEEASARLCQQYDERTGPFLPVSLIVHNLEICHRDTAPILIEAMMVVRIRRALRRSDLADLEENSFIYGRLQQGLLWQYLRSKHEDLKSRLMLFLHDLFLPQVEHALSTFSVLPAQRKVTSLANHEVMLVLIGNTS